MNCRIVKDGELTMFVCGRRREPPKCAFCDNPSTRLCDFPVSSGQQITHRRTCDKPMCNIHAKNVGPNRDFCPDHQGAA